MFLINSQLFYYHRFSVDQLETSLSSSQYSINILDDGGITQLSTVLKPGQILSVNYSGVKLAVDPSGNIVNTASVAVSCDGKVLSFEQCALFFKEI